MIKTALQNALANAWPMLTIFCVIIIAVRLAYVRINRRDFILHNEIMTLFFILYTLLLFELLTGTENSSYGQNLIPFTEIFRYKVGSELFYYNVIGNIVMFIPFGYFVSRYINANKISSIFVVTLVASFTVELVQSKIGRAFDIDDIILNVAGAICGFLLHIALAAIKKHMPEFLQRDFIYDVLSIVFLIAFFYFFSHTIGFGWL